MASTERSTAEAEREEAEEVVKDAEAEAVAAAVVPAAAVPVAVAAKAGERNAEAACMRVCCFLVVFWGGFRFREGGCQRERHGERKERKKKGDGIEAKKP